MIGVLAANREPDRFAKLVLVGPSPRYIDDVDYVGGFSPADIDELLDSLDSNYLGWSQAMAPVIMGNADRPELGGELTDSFCRTDPVIAKRFARATFLSDNRGDLARVSVPTLVLQCRDDVIAPQAVGRFVHQSIPGSELVILDATGHCPNLSAPGCDDRRHRRLRPSMNLDASGPADAFFDEAPCGYIAASADGVIRRVNHTLETMTGVRADELVGRRTFASLLSVGGRIYVETHLAPLLLNDGAVRGVALELVHADGHRVPVLVSATLAHRGDRGDRVADRRVRRRPSAVPTSRNCSPPANAPRSRRNGPGCSFERCNRR